MANEFQEFIKLAHNASTQGKLGEIIFKFVKNEVAEIKKQLDLIKVSLEVLDKRDEWIAARLDEIELASREQSSSVVEVSESSESADTTPSKKKIKKIKLPQE